MLARPPGPLAVELATVLVPLGVSVVMLFGTASPPMRQLSDARARPPLGRVAQVPDVPPPETREQARVRKHKRLKVTLAGTHACGGLID